MTFLRKLRGWYRLKMGWCPACNSDAPAVDTCKVCKSFRPVSTSLAAQFKDLWWQRFVQRGCQ